jgi:hypothetical protein
MKIQAYMRCGGDGAARERFLPVGSMFEKINARYLKRSLLSGRRAQSTPPPRAARRTIDTAARERRPGHLTDLTVPVWYTSRVYARLALIFCHSLDSQSSLHLLCL